MLPPSSASMPTRTRSFRLSWTLAAVGAAAVAPAQTPDGAASSRPAELSGYMLVPVEKAPAEYNAGFSLYAAAWPLVEAYPGSRFQSGLFGTWMFAQYEGDKPKDLYSDIEGGLGWWRDTRFATTTPKFIMGGVAPNFIEWANGPGAGKGRDWDQPRGKYAIAQLSPFVVWPPDGLNLRQGTCGELFGYGYLPLPLVDEKPVTKGKDVPTGGQCWTLFLNTSNFKGPLCFFTPFFWSQAFVDRPELAGQLLDSRPSEPNKAFQMETQWIPARVGQADGATYGRVAPTSFPVDEQGRTVVLHQLTCYSRAALTDAVAAWFAGGPAASGAIDERGVFVQTFKNGGGSTWRLFADGTDKDQRPEVDWKSFGRPVAHDAHTYGYVWDEAVVHRKDDARGRRAMLPELFRLQEQEGKKPRWVVADAQSVPAAAGLADLRVSTPKQKPPEPYVTPVADSPFQRPGPAAGPFETTLGDGSVVTYCWYRFADQPALQQADLSEREREEAQRRVELLHRVWTKDRDYLPPPKVGELAALDPGLIVVPPKGLEIGYVPIAVRQGPASERR